MYNITRDETAKILGISTRTVDRHIRAGKLRAKKVGKIVYINNNDIDNISSKTSQVFVSKDNNNNNNKTELKKQDKTVEYIYNDLRNEIEQKNNKIQDLSMELGQTKEILKNSVSLIELKKTTLALEQSRETSENKIKKVEDKNESLQKKLSEEKNINLILLVFAIILFGISILLFYVRI